MVTGIKIDNDLIDKVTKLAQSQKKINNFDEAKTSLGSLLKFIDQINHVPEFQFQIWNGYLIDDIQIPKELSDFVMPKTIRWVASDRKCTDLIDRGNVEVTDFVFSNLADLEIAIQTFRGAYKKDGFSDLVRIGDLRKDVSLSDAIDRVASKGQVRYLDRPFVPISIPVVGDLFNKGWFNTDISVVLTDYIADLRFI